MSLLSPLEPMRFETKPDALAQLRPGVRRRNVRVRLAPRARSCRRCGRSFRDPTEFIGQLKHKAGLPPDFWDPAVKLSRYTVYEVDARSAHDHERSTHPGRWWHLLDDGRMQCDLCPRDCRLHEGQRGACFVRQRVGDGRWC